MTPKQWHWQERLDVVAEPDEACRRQLHQIHERISYHVWLKQKRASAGDKARRAVDENSRQDDADKRERSEAAFREWRARKNREQRRKKKATDLSQEDRTREAAAVKPPSQHVNPKTKCVKQASTSLRKSDRKRAAHHARQSAEQNTAAYDAWLVRVRLEDRVRRSQRRQERARETQRAREAHATKWEKKLVVCAYSTAASLKSPPSPRE